MRERKAQTARTHQQRHAVAKAQGKDAYAKGLPMSQNPYRFGTSTERRWNEGWFQAETEAHQQEK